MPELLLELFSEEIPARMQHRAAEDLRALITQGLVDAGLTYEGAQAHATPRRLVLSVEGCDARAADQREERKGPRIDAPEQAIEGFLKSTGLTIGDLAIQEDRKGRFYTATLERKGRSAEDVIAALVPDVIRKFPWPKSMRWGEGTLRWVRPLHSILCTFDGEVVPFEIDGIASGSSTRGHRFLSQRAVTARRFDDYATKLMQNYVVVDAHARAETIRVEAKNLAFAQGLDLIEDEALIRETAGLVEWPVVLMGEFDAKFLDVPPEVIVTSIKTHQKCFALRDAKTGALANRYLMVANMIAADGGKEIVAGNNKVIAARLSDARFFWEQDRKTPLENLLPKLDSVTFHAKLGSQGERVKRIENLAGFIAEAIGANVEKARLGARLAKADLASGMVGEFPELQGLMGRYYALEQGINPEVADAIKDHYKPVGPTDGLPSSHVGQAVALADKLDVLVCFWAIDEKPTGSKDPYALRRAALGIVRTILDKGLRLKLTTVFQKAYFFGSGGGSHRTGGSIGEKAEEIFRSDLLAFFAERLKVHLKDQGIRHDLIDAVFALGNQDDLLMIVKRVEALSRFLDSDDGKNLLAGVKRASNIVRIEEKNDGRTFGTDVNIGYLIQPEEKALHTAVNQALAQAHRGVENEDFESAMTALARLRAPVDSFFDRVTVNDRDMTFRENRLKLLNRIRMATLPVADFSRIES